MQDDFDWTLIRSFLAVIEEGSLLAAAKRLRSSQPTLGRHMALLEQQLGLSLFERTGRGLTPNAAALGLAERARAMADNAAAIGLAASGQGDLPSGTVRITASQTVAAYLLPPLLRDMRQELPGIAIEVVSSNAVSNLLRREADIAIRMVRPNQATLVARKIAEVGLGAYAHKDYLRQRGTPKSAADLLRHDLIGYDADEVMIEGFRAGGLDVDRDTFQFRCDDHIVLGEALRAGLGIGFLAEYVARRDTGLVRLALDLPLPRLPVWLTVHREIRSSRRIRLAYDFLAKAIPDALAA